MITTLRSINCDFDNIVANLIDGADTDGLFFFFLSDFRIQKGFNSQQQFDSVNTVEFIGFAQISIHIRIFDFKFPLKNVFYFALNFLTCHR